MKEKPLGQNQHGGPPKVNPVGPEPLEVVVLAAFVSSGASEIALGEGYPVNDVTGAKLRP